MIESVVMHVPMHYNAWTRSRGCLGLLKATLNNNHMRCAGAKVLAGGTREGPMMEATLLEEVPSDCDLMRSEVFGPVLILQRYAVFRDAINRCIPCFFEALFTQI